MAGGASGAVGGRAAGRTEGRSRAGRLSSWCAIPLLLAWSRGAHDAGRSVQHSACIDDAHSFSEAAQKPPAPGRPAGRQAVSQPLPVVYTARASVRSAGGGPQSAQKPPPPAQPPQSARAKAGQRCFGAWAETRRRAEGCRRAPSWARFVCVVADVVVVRRLSGEAALSCPMKAPAPAKCSAQQDGAAGRLGG